MIPNHCIENNQQFTHTGGDDHLKRFALLLQALRKPANHRITITCRQSSHIKNAANIFASALDMTFANPFSRGTIPWCQTSQSCYFLTIETSKLRHLSQQNSTCLWADAGFGRSVSISGDYAIVGAACDDDWGNDSGSAYIFRRSDEPNDPNWNEQQKLTASDGSAYDYFGYSVSISGDKTIIGAFCDDDKGGSSGSAYIFSPRGAIGELTVLAPNGGENLAAGSIYNIIWDTKGMVEDVFIEYSDNNGVDWTAIDMVANTGSYEWLVPDVNSNQCLVRISNTVYPPEMDISDDVFRIYVCADWLTTDLNNNCFVDFRDFSILGNQWFQSPSVPSADLASPGGDGVVNFRDLGIIVDQWLDCGDPCDPNCQP